MRAVALLLSLILVSPANATVLFISGFEMGYPNINSTNGDTWFEWGITQFKNNPPIRTGAWVMQDEGTNSLPTNLVTGAGSSPNPLMNTATIACRLYFYAVGSGGVPVAQDEILAYRTTGGRTFQVGLDSNQHVNIKALGGFSAVTGTATVPADQWVRLDFIYDAAAGGVGKVYVAAALDISTTHTGTQLNVKEVELSGSPAPTHYLFDDILCQDGTSLPPDGHIIVRQGKLAAPTDDAFTKNGCTTIDTCWSDTPFDKTTNASSGNTTSSVAQTMFVAPFSTPQAGHGTEFLHSGDQINAVVIGIVAKTSTTASGGAAGKIRHYVSGVATDFSINLTTADAFYKTNAFTDTPAHLDLYEIGWVKSASAGAANHTVEDIWIMVDYTGPNFILQNKVSNGKFFSLTGGGPLQGRVPN